MVLEIGSEPETGLANPDLVTEGARGSLGLGIDTIAHWAALHEDDRMVAILARDGGGEPQHISCLRATRDELETDGRKMVALVDNQVAIIADQIIDVMSVDAADARVSYSI